MKPRVIILILAFIIIGLAAFAENPLAFSVTSAETGVFTVMYKRPETGKVKLSIYNDHNKLVFAEVLSNVGSFIRPYNFNELAEGDYTIVLEDKNGRHEEKISHKSADVLSFIRVNAVANETDKYVLNVVTNGKESVSVKIFDNVKGLVHEQQVEVTGSYGLLYNLNKVKSSASAIVIFEVTTASGKVVTAMF
jgi:hypothetical protein